MKSTLQNKTKVVNIGDIELVSQDYDILSAPNLGSCLGIVIVDRKNKLSGIVHCLLPMSSSDPQKAKDRPGLYVDSGVVALLNLLISQGAEKRELKIFVAGGANVMDTANVFEIGKRNYTIFRKVLWKNGLLIHWEEVGGCTGRTISVDTETLEVWLKKDGEHILVS